MNVLLSHHDALCTSSDDFFKNLYETSAVARKQQDNNMNRHNGEDLPDCKQSRINVSSSPPPYTERTGKTIFALMTVREREMEKIDTTDDDRASEETVQSEDDSTSIGSLSEGTEDDNIDFEDWEMLMDALDCPLAGIESDPEENLSFLVVHEKLVIPRESDTNINAKQSCCFHVPDMHAAFANESDEASDDEMSLSLAELGEESCWMSVEETYPPLYSPAIMGIFDS